MAGSFLEDDLDGFLDSDEFGDIATLQSGATLSGIFDMAYVEVAGIEGYRPTLVCKSSAVSANSITNDTVLSINGNDYQVATPEPDGTGMTLLVLKLRGPTVTYPVVFSSDFSSDFA